MSANHSTAPTAKSLARASARARAMIGQMERLKKAAMRRCVVSEKNKARVEAATVRLAKLGGRGVLVPGGFILTAAHCVDWSGTGGMALGDFFVERVETADGRKFLTSVFAAEPVADVAALGAMDN